jgi:hypothetical protein
MPEEKSDLELTLRALLLCQLKSLELGEQVDVLSKAGWSSPQVAQITGMTPEAIRKRKSRTKEK